MEDPANAANDNASNEAGQQEGKEGIVEVWKFDCNVSFIKSIFGIFTIALVVLSLLCCIILSAAKNILCYGSYTSTYDFYNFAFGSCILTYMLRFIIYVLSFDKKFLWIVPWLIWNSCVSLFFAICFFFASIAVIAAPGCGTAHGGYQAAAAFGFITFFVMAGELVYNIILLRRNHPPTDNRILLLIGVERKPSGTAPVYEAGTDAGSPQEEESKY